VAFIYGVVCYLIFLCTFLYAAWFVWRMDGIAATQTNWVRAVLIDAVLLSIFALQHSVMARQGFKRMWTKIVPPPIERSTYVLFASLALLILIRFWQPIPGTVWNVENETGRMLLQGLFFLGWGIVLVSTFLINHFDLFGLRQVWLYLRQKPYEPLGFRTPVFYRHVRHPIYMGFILGFWATPHMTYAHLFFAVMTLAYILVAIQLEERDLVTMHGEQYQVYRSGVSMLMPIPKKRK
jgi:protein-S-isoprenylcysteine O-methyltransferase Ste14